MDKELTFGELAVGKGFNPSAFKAVDDIKDTQAAAIDVINDLRSDPGNVGEQVAMYTLAIRKNQEAQMWAVKASTWSGN